MSAAAGGSVTRTWVCAYRAALTLRNTLEDPATLLLTAQIPGKIQTAPPSAPVAYVQPPADFLLRWQEEVISACHAAIIQVTAIRNLVVLAETLAIVVANA